MKRSIFFIALILCFTGGVAFGETIIDGVPSDDGGGYSEGDDIIAGSVTVGTTTVTVAGPTDNVDVTSVCIVKVDTSSNNVTIGGFIGGRNGQSISVVIIDPTGNCTLEHAEATGNQDIYLESGADETKTTSYGGWVLTYDDGKWKQCGGSGAAAGGSTTYPSGSGIPVVSGGASWGTTYTLTTLMAALNAIAWAPTSTVDLSGATVTFGLTMSDMPTTGDLTPSSGTWDLTSLTGLTLPAFDAVSSPDPLWTFNVTDADDTDWTIGTNADAGASSDDDFEFRLSATPGTGVILRLEPDTGDMVFNGATDDAHTLRFDITDPTGTRILKIGDFDMQLPADTAVDDTGKILAAGLAADAKFQSIAVAALSDAATPSVLTTAETINKCISNYKSSGADHVFTMCAAHAGGNVIFPIGDEFQVDIEPPTDDLFYLNGTAMAANEHIQNTADTLGERIVGYCVNINGTLRWMFYSSDTAWVEETPPA